MMRNIRISGAVIAIVALVATPVQAQAPEARSTDAACADAPEDGFVDTGDQGSPTEQAVDCVVWYGVARGTTADTYEPSVAITRAQMATMLAGSLRATELDLAEPAAGEDFFTDDDGSVHEDNIDYVAKHGVSSGVSQGRFAPSDPVTRAQMATFLVNLLDTVGVTLPEASANHFVDDEGSVHEDNINRLADAGITSGTTAVTYEPGAPVTRAQMALFIGRELALMVEEGVLAVPDLPEDRVALTVQSREVAIGSDVIGELAASVEGVTLQSAVVDGCGLSSAEVDDTDAATAGIQFSETIPLTQPLGDCTLRFTSFLDPEAAEQDQVTITVTLPESVPPPGLPDDGATGDGSGDGSDMPGLPGLGLAAR